MALFRSPILSAASGSVAGTTFSHNRGGMYMRARATPTNPNSDRQTVVRAALSQMATRWSQVLTADQREAWTVYAAAVSVKNALGDSIFLTGQQMFIRSATVASQIAVDLPDDAPIDFSLGTFGVVAFNAIQATTNEASITFAGDDTWVDEDGSAMIAWFSKPVGTAINYFRGPYRFGDTIPGDAVTPPTSPETLAMADNFEVGQRGFGRIRVYRLDGRLSNEVFIGPAVAA